MAGGIKGITVEIGGDTTKLGKALAEVNSKTKSLQSELKGVNTLLKMDPGNVTLLTQKQDILTEAIAGTKEKLETLKNAQEQVQEQFEKGEITEEQYRDFQREIIATEKKLEGLTDELKNFGSVGAQQVAQVGEKMKDVGGKVTEFGKGFSVVSAGTGAVLAGSIAAFVELDEGYDTIITKTGATGEALDDLNAVADNIFSSMPTDMATVGIAVGEINTRFGYTGEQLEALSTQFIQFAEINGVDLNNSIGTVDKILEQFNMDASETGGVLDLVTQKAQQTGIGADTLMNLIQQNGATFKDMGMGVNEAVVLLSQFEANGVNVETAMKGLKKATVEYAKEGISMEEGLAKTIDTVKNAKTETEALAEVEKLFGAKGANEMVKAIREGRLSVDDLSSAMGEYGGVVSDTFNATLDPIDQGKVAMNNLKLAGSELGGVLQTTFAPMLTTIVEKLKSLATWFGNLSPGIQKTIVVVLAVVTALGPLIIGIGQLITAVGTILTFAPKLVTAFNAVKTAMLALNTSILANPIFLLIAGIVALVAAIGVLVYKLATEEKAIKSTEQAQKDLTDAKEKAKDAENSYMDAIDRSEEALKRLEEAEKATGLSGQELFDSVQNGTLDYANMTEQQREVYKAYLENEEAQKALTEATNANNEAKKAETKASFENQLALAAESGEYDKFKQSVIDAFNSGQLSAEEARDLLGASMSEMSASAQKAFMEDIPGDIKNGLDPAQYQTTWQQFTTGCGKVWEDTKQVFSDVGSWFKTKFTEGKESAVNAWNDAKAKWATVKEKCVEGFSDFKDKVKTKFTEAKTNAEKAWSDAKTKFNNVKTNVVTAFSDLGSKVSPYFSKAKTAAQNTWSTTKAYWNRLKEGDIVGVFNDLGGKLKTKFSSSLTSAKQGFSKIKQIGKDLLTGLWDGINDKFSWLTGKIKSFANNVTDKLKSFFKIKSPSRVMRDEVGKQLVAGIIAGIDAEKDNAKKSAQELGELYLKEIESTIKKKQDYREIAIGDEIFLWSEVLKKFKKGSDNYKDAELKLLDAHTKFIDDQRKTNNMSVQDEMVYWLNLSATCEEGSVLYKGIMDQFTEANKEYEESFVESHQKYIDQRKKNNTISLSDEVQYWKKLLKQTDRNSDNYSKIYEKMYDAEKKLTEESKELQTKYLEDVQSIKDKLIKDIQAVTDAYDKAVNDRKKSIVSSMSLFDAFNPKGAVDKYTLTDNLESQVEALKEWDSTLDALSQRRGLKNSDLLKDLQGMGVDNLGTLQQINAMSDAELQNYINLYDEKNRVALERATVENEALRIESQRQIEQLTIEANNQLNALEITYAENLESLGLTMRDRSKRIGNNIVYGLMDGVNAETPTFQSYLTNFFNSIVASAENALGIHSPSRVFADVVGKQIPAGIAKGILDNSGVANKAIIDMTTNLTKEATHLNGATINRKLNTTFSAKLDNGRTLTDIMETMINCSDKIYDRLNRLQIVLDSGALVGETIDKIDATLADRQILTARGL